MATYESYRRPVSPDLQRATPESLVQIGTPIWDVCEKASGIGEWPGRPMGPTPFSLSGYGVVGQGIHFQFMTGGYTDPTIDVMGVWFEVLSPYNDPKTLIVLSGREPAVVSLESQDWRAELAAAVINAAETPGTYFDFELEMGTRYSCMLGTETEQLLGHHRSHT
ncbi:MAG: hypothetical protein WC489_00420 [Patescibacteria group bacterium]